MSTALTLSAQPRTALGKVVDKLRRQRSIPAVVYGHNLASKPVTLSMGEFSSVFRQAGSTSLVDVVIGTEAPVKALIHDVQRHPTSGAVTHVDLYQVRMTEKLEAEIDIELLGEAPAVKEQGGILVRAMDKLKVSCLPTDLVPSISVDVSALKTFDDKIHVSDVVLPAGLTAMDKPEEVVVSVAAPRSEAELASLSEKVEENVEAVGTVEKKAKADDETAEENAETPPANDK